MVFSKKKVKQNIKSNDDVYDENVEFDMNYFNVPVSIYQTYRIT